MPEAKFWFSLRKTAASTFLPGLVGQLPTFGACCQVNFAFGLNCPEAIFIEKSPNSPPNDQISSILIGKTAKLA